MNLGTRTSVQRYVIGCPCHILHSTSSKAAAVLASTTGFHVEDLAVDLAVDVSYWFGEAQKEKLDWKNFACFVIQHKEVVAQVSNCWLSLEQAINCMFELCVRLASYSKSTSECQARFSKTLKEIHRLHNC